jgi:membrane protease YdiL (CAAX protease family)
LRFFTAELAWKAPFEVLRMWIVLFLVLLGFVAVLSDPGRLKRHPFSRRRLNDLQSLLFQRLLAASLMAPVLIFAILDKPDWWSFSRAAWMSIFLIALILPPLAILTVNKSKDEKQEAIFAPMTRGSWLWVQYLTFTTAYMIMYEVLMRGVFLYALADQFHIILAVAINTLLYAAMHLTKNLKEALLCIPLGIFLCWLTLYTGSIWPAAFFHLIFAVSFELSYSSKLNHVNA